jgi:hypothetical protein
VDSARPDCCGRWEDVLQNTQHDHRVLVAEWPLAGSQYCRDQGARVTVEDHQRQVAGRTIVVAVERQRLLAVTSIFGVIQVEDQALGRAGEAGDKLLDEGLADVLSMQLPL